MSDPFADLRRLVLAREVSDDALRLEVGALRSAGYSLRAIAAAANLSPDTVMRWTR
ncbi:MAG TPA: helix-turn-helix domain-containing protein [Acidimicrobiia bacterium]